MEPWPEDIKDKFCYKKGEINYEFVPIWMHVLIKRTGNNIKVVRNVGRFSRSNRKPFQI